MKRFLVVLMLWGAVPVMAEQVVVHNASELRDALQSLANDTTLRIAGGEYPGGHYVRAVNNLTVEALDPAQPPHFKGGSNAWQFSRCHHLTLRNLLISGQSDNGLNLDDGGRFDEPVIGITIERVNINDVGPEGNHDGIKCSGLDQVTIRDCRLEGWGGQGIDMVGCHHSIITGCQFIGKPGFSASAGVQTKGGASDIVIENCVFKNAGERPLNIGGSTGLSLFRPSGAKYEARRIVVRKNVIEGGLSGAAFVGVDGAEFSQNKILFPMKWIFRVLQETTAKDFPPCRNVVIKDNLIVFRRSEVQTDINIGGGTDPESFQFEGNHWIAEDRPQASKPKLPVPEKNGRYGVNPRSSGSGLK